MFVFMSAYCFRKASLLVTSPSYSYKEWRVFNPRDSSKINVNDSKKNGVCLPRFGIYDRFRESVCVFNTFSYQSVKNKDDAS